MKGSSKVRHTWGTPGGSLAMCPVLHWTSLWWAPMPLLLPAPAVWSSAWGARMPHWQPLLWPLDASGFRVRYPSGHSWRLGQVIYPAAGSCSAATMLLWGCDASLLLVSDNRNWAQVEEQAHWWAWECALPLEWDLTEFVALWRPTLTNLSSRSSWSSCIKRSRCWTEKMLGASQYGPQ